MKFKRVLAAVLVSGMTFLSACGSQPASTSKSEGTESKKIKDGGNIVFSIGSDPQALNPLYASDRVTMTINNALYSPLFTLTGDRAKYYLAESVTPSEDYMTYTVKLKKNLKWHDGKPITVDDVIFTMQKILDEKQNSFLRELFIIDGKPVTVNKVDDTTVEFKLPALTMAFMGSLTQVCPIPKHVFENETDLSKSTKNDAPIGSGPFKFKEFNKGESVTLVRFDDYVGGKPHLDSVVFRVIADANSANVALQNGEIAAKYIQPKDAEKYKKDSNFKLVIYDEGMLSNMVFNMNNNTLASKEVKQAIAYAINKDELIKASYVSEDYAQKAYTILTPDVLYYTENVNHYDNNETKAKELLDKAGVKDLKLNLAYMNSSKEDESKALVVQQNLKKIGVEVTLAPLERGAFLKKFLDPKNNEWDLAFNGFVMGSEPDSYKSIFMTGQIYNTSKYSNKEIDDLWNKGVIEKDKAKRQAIYEELQKKIVDDMPLYPIAYSKSIVAISKKYGGVEEAKPVPIFMFQDLSKLYVTE